MLHLSVEKTPELVVMHQNPSSSQSNVGKRGDGKAMENVSYVRDENGPEAPLTAANLSLKITSTQLDQEFYLGPTQTKKNQNQVNC